MTGRRRAAERRGRQAEALCAWRLRLAGYRILARGWRSPVGEIDLIARRGRVVAFVEVKARGETAAGLEAVGRRKRARVMRAAQAFLKARPELAPFSPRFDVMVVRPWRWPLHLPAAWIDGD